VASAVAFMVSAQVMDSMVLPLSCVTVTPRPAVGCDNPIIARLESEVGDKGVSIWRHRAGFLVIAVTLLCFRRSRKRAAFPSLAFGFVLAAGSRRCVVAVR
jgi:hypothetical protein